MKVLMINSVCGVGSTGRICTDLAEQFEKDGHQVKIAYGRNDEVPEKFSKYAVRIGNDVDVKLHGLKTRILDKHGFGSVGSTRRFLKWVDEYKPDLLWLHNIHGYYINIELLFEWIKKQSNLTVRWTLHDCWTFTGHCAYFTMLDCDKWKSHCNHCPQKNKYPESKIKDNSHWNFEKKRKLFTGVQHMTLITPSKWLADLVKESYLSEYPVEVVYNKINTDIFKPTPSNFRDKYGLHDKKIILGVASVWEDRKGLKDLWKLTTMLDDSYAVVLVGMNEKQIEEMKKYSEQSDYISCNFVKQISEMETKDIIECSNGFAIPKDVNILYKTLNKVLPSANINNTCNGKAVVVAIPSTTNSKELAQIYTAADVFVNPTYEDNYPTVNLEAVACGTKVITYDTGGCKETIS